MTPKIFLCALVISISGSAVFAQNSKSVDPMHGPGTRMWQCTAHSTHYENNIYYGDRNQSRHEAEHSAIDECEYQEGHQCALHECYQVR
jgi:hypothetical protein